MNDEFRKQRLFSPGPTPIPLQFQMAALDKNPYHRTQEFYTVFLNCRKLLAKIMYSQQLPLILSSSGTGALESAVVNLTEVDDQVLVINGGKFGERWSKLCKAYSCNLKELKLPWGTAPTPDELASALKAQPSIKAVFFQALETSTGVALPVQELAKVVQDHSDALVVVDAVSGFASEMIKMDEWGLDALVTGSQKGLGLPPGLSFINLSAKAESRLSKRPKFYFDLKRELAEQKQGKSGFTPATQLVLMLERSLEYINSTGFEQVHQRHQLVAKSVRESLKQMGLKLFASRPACGLTSVLLPESIDGQILLQELAEKHQMVFAGGQEDYKGRLLRFAHMGYFDPNDIVAGLVALEEELQKLGHPMDNLSVAQNFWRSYRGRSL